MTLTLTTHPVKTTELTGEICLGGTYNENGFDITPTEAGVTTHTLNLHTTHDCDSTVTLTLTTHPNPIVAVNSLSDICPESDATLTATITTSTQADYTYDWSGDLVSVPGTSTTSALTSSAEMTIPAPPASCGKTYYEYVTVTDAHNCKNTATAVITIKNPDVPVITTTAVNADLGCNPAVTAPTFTVNDDCAGTFTLPVDSVTDGGVVNTSDCGRSRTWTAHYTDPCGNRAGDVSVTYNWTEDHENPVIHTEAVSDHKGCNPTIVAPTFTVTDNCEGAFILPAANISTTGKVGEGCEKSQTWTANYTDGCGNPAEPVSVTYYWTEDHVAPVITASSSDTYLDCDPTTMTPPTFTVTDNCEGTFVLSNDNVTDSGVLPVIGEEHKYSRSWTATYTDGCNNPAEPVTVTYTWVVAPTVSISCPPDVYDTLAYGDCVMNIYPEQIGTPVVNAPEDWPMAVSNDIPADYLFQEGTTIVTWTATDPVCGYSVSCEQKVIVVFPKCPDAVDCEGNVYHGVRIDCDCWTQTNLQSTYYGNPGACEEEIPCTYLYQSNTHPEIDILGENFGRLYCPEAGLRDSVINEYGHIRGICPEGWYLPTPEKYAVLNLHGDIGLKTPTYWTDGGGLNTTGFTWLPAGWYNGALQRFEGLTSEGYFLSTEILNGEVHTVVIEMNHDCGSTSTMESHSGYGYSVRCIKEKE